MEFTKIKRNKLGNVTVSHEWIRQFKIIMDSSSRKITTVIPSKSEIDNEKIMEQGCNFVEYATKKLVNFDLSMIVNSDQNRFNYELNSSRMLNTIGEKDILCSINSLNALFHSYTIQSTLNFNGNFIGKCLLVLQEPNGSFGVNVKKNIYFNLKIY